MARPSTFVSKSQIATLLNLSNARASQLIKAGMPVRSDGRLNQDRAREWYTAHVRPRAKTATAPQAPQGETTRTDPVHGTDESRVPEAGAPESYWDLRTKLIAVQLEKAQFDLDLQMGKYCDAENTASIWAEVMTAVKDGVLGLHNRIVMRLPAESLLSKTGSCTLK